MSNKITLTLKEIPEVLQTIPNPPETLYVTGVNIEETMQRPRVAIVGSRKVTSYGDNITTKLASELAKCGVVIVSGLALGIDALAHKAALKAGGLTVAVLPNSLDSIYPSSHAQLARNITKQGVLISEYRSNQGMKSYKGNFIARNRLVSGLSDAVLVTEAAENSGTLHTAHFAIKQGKKLFAVPGNITSPTSAGTNALIRQGATLVTSAQDILSALNIPITVSQPVVATSDNPNEQKILTLLQQQETLNGAELQAMSALETPLFNQCITMLEIKGLIRASRPNIWTLV